MSLCRTDLIWQRINIEERAANGFRIAKEQCPAKKETAIDCL